MKTICILVWILISLQIFARINDEGALWKGLYCASEYGNSPWIGGILGFTLSGIFLSMVWLLAPQKNKQEFYVSLRFLASYIVVLILFYFMGEQFRVIFCLGILVYSIIYLVRLFPEMGQVYHDVRNSRDWISKMYRFGIFVAFCCLLWATFWFAVMQCLKIFFQISQDLMFAIVEIPLFLSLWIFWLFQFLVIILTSNPYYKVFAFWLYYLFIITLIF